MITSILKSASAGIIFLAIVMSVEFVGSADSASGLFVSVLLVYGACILVGIIAVGVPFHLIFKWLKLRSVYSYALAGLVPPILISLLFKPFGEDSATDLLVQSAIAGAIGFICAYTFWRSEVASKNA